MSARPPDLDGIVGAVEALGNFWGILMVQKHSVRTAGRDGDADIRVDVWGVAARDPGWGAEESFFGTTESPQYWSVGVVDRATHQQIAGWCWDPRHPDDPVQVEVLDGDAVVLTVTADMYREDLRNSGFGNGRHAFEIPNPGVLFPLSIHQISVRRAKDGAHLLGSPDRLTRPMAGIDPPLFDLMQKAAKSAMKSAAAADDLDQQIQLQLQVLDRLLVTRQSLDKMPGAIRDPRLQMLLDEADLSDWMRELVNRLEQNYPLIHLDVAVQPLVSIIIPVYNKFQITYNCIKSVAATLPKRSFEIIIVDDCSKDETLLAGLTGLVFSGAVRIVRNPKNAGFVRSCNAGAAQARGEYLFFLNNDTLVRPGWLDELVQTFEAVPNVGIVGSRLFFEDGRQQEVGGIIWRLGDGWNWGRLADRDDPKFCFLRDADYVSGAALMIRRDCFESLKGFDELFVPAYYEDTDLCFRVRALGKRVVVQPASEIVHLEGVSAGTDVHGSGMKRYQLVNHRKFYERWKDTLATHRFNAQQPELEAERMVKKRAYFIDDSVPTPDQDAGSNAALQHMLALMRLGYKVIFIPADNMARINPYTANLEKLGIECYYAPYYWSVEEVFRKTAVKPDLVYLHRYSNASKYANMVRQHFPDARILYNVADLHFLRQQRELEVEGSLGGVHAISEQAELAAMAAVDAVIVHSSVEADLLRQRNPELDVHTIPWTVRARPTDIAFERRSGFAFVGGYGHRPNVDAAMYLAKDILPLVVRRQPQLCGYLVGSKPPPQLTALESAHLKVMGFVPELEPLLHRLRCTVAPLRYGAGLKGKVLESFAHGLPCVMTQTAAEGMDLPENLHWLVAASTADFADKVSSLCEDGALNERLAQSGLAFIANRFSADAITEALRFAW